MNNQGGRVCPSCTFINEHNIESCEICGLPLSNQEHHLDKHPVHIQPTIPQSSKHQTQTKSDNKNKSPVSQDAIRNMIAKIWKKPDPEPKKITPIEQNKLDAYETIPESFIPADLLYIPIEIGELTTKALVDTGAQMTIMSSSFAEKCNLSHLIDRKYEGKARGVGERKIVGRIWMVDVQIGVHLIPCSFTVLEDFHIDLIFGVDMLRTHNCNIDFHKRCLIIGGHNISFVEHTVPPPPSSSPITDSKDLKDDTSKTEKK